MGFVGITSSLDLDLTPMTVATRRNSDGNVTARATLVCDNGAVSLSIPGESTVDALPATFGGHADEHWYPAMPELVDIQYAFPLDHGDQLTGTMYFYSSDSADTTYSFLATKFGYRVGQTVEALASKVLEMKHSSGGCPMLRPNYNRHDDIGGTRLLGQTQVGVAPRHAVCYPNSPLALDPCPHSSPTHARPPRIPPIPRVAPAAVVARLPRPMALTHPPLLSTRNKPAPLHSFLTHCVPVR